VTDREGRHRAIFILRLERDPLGRITGTVERVRTGEKVRLAGLAEVGPLLTAMLAGEEAPRGDDPARRPDGAAPSAPSEPSGA
jgi:hypothetical protein